MQSSLALAEKLKPRLAGDFQRKLLTASLQSALQEANPLRLNNFSTSFRELFRHVLDKLAPTQEVQASMWFTPDQTNGGKVTRGQRVAYVVHGGLSPEYVENDLGIDIAGERTALLKTIDRLSKFTHVNENSFGFDTTEVERQVYESCKALSDFLDCADAARSQLCNRVEERVQDGVVNQAINETMLAVDEIAHHHSIEDVYIEIVEVTSLDSKEIHFTAYGTVEVMLQWGSSSDVRRGDGVEISDSYPLTCRFVSPVDDPEELEMLEDSLCIDTSSWWDGYYDDESQPEGTQ